MDETMRGQYQYANMKMTLLKFVKQKDVDPASQTPAAEVVAFVDADYVQHQLCDLEIPSISAGDYMLICKNEWSRIHTARKMVISVYAAELVELTKVASEHFPRILEMKMDNWLNYRLSLDSSYKFPRYALAGASEL